MSTASGTTSERESSPRVVRSTAQVAIYSVALSASVASWFLAVRAPLWLDETFSFWQIDAGFSHILTRRGSLSPAYAYILWLTTRITGTSEVGLRVPSILAMLAAAYFLYRAARELFGRDVAGITAVLFCIHPIVSFSAIDARPYAFAILTTNLAIFLLIRMRSSNSDSLAAFFGIVAGLIAYFQLAFSVIFPGFAICFLCLNSRAGTRRRRQFAIAIGAFALVFAPNIPDLVAVFHSRQALVFNRVAPTLADLGVTIATGRQALILLLSVLMAAATRRLNFQSPLERSRLLLVASLGLVPLLILYIVSVNTPTNVFVERYRLVAIPGIALAWGLLLSCINSHLIRIAFCLAVVGTAVFGYVVSPYSSQHGYTWKYALSIADKNAAIDHAPILICSDFPNADYVPMPSEAEVKDSGLFTPLAYYKVDAPVVGLPRALNREAMRVGEAFVQRQAARHQRFLALAWEPSYPTMFWITNLASATHEVRTLAEPDGVVVLEFTPRDR